MFQAETGRHWGFLGLVIGALLAVSPTPAKALVLSPNPDSTFEDFETSDHSDLFRKRKDDLAIDDEDLKEHYVIDDPKMAFGIDPSFESPEEIITHAQAAVARLMKAVDSAMTLTNWLKVSGPLDPAPERYNRKSQFGTWRRDRTGGNCLDARGTVLARSSTVPVTTRPGSGGRCVVDRGHWLDPYNGKEFYIGSEVSIDHMVPLKNAYLAGGWRWTNQKRCQYFNFTASPDHLLAVSIPENSSKGDDSPADYMPPVRSYQCQYLKSWLSVKAVWGLAIAGEEASAIREEVKQLGCRETDMRISTSEVTRLRAEIAKGSPACPAPRENVETMSELAFDVSTDETADVLL